jgi:hypothetical protein
VTTHPSFQPGFDPPAPPRTERLRLLRLSPDVVELDFAALMSSRARLREELQWGTWPRDDFTVDENREDLEGHDGEFERREAYAYTVLDPSGEICLGCIYLEPWEGDARLAFWVIDDEVDGGLEEHLVATVRDWIRAYWSFDRLLIPLRASNPRGARVVTALGFELLDSGGLEDHVNYVWSRDH